MNTMQGSFIHAAKASVIVVLCILIGPLGVRAADKSLSVTVTPPLFQLTIGPGESWSSTLKVVNNNDYDVTYYATPVDFEADGENGKGRFIPLVDGLENSAPSADTLGHWIEVSSDPIVVPRGRSGEMPFTVRIPENADPGGHYAAILIGTKSGEGEIDGPRMKVSSFVSSLLFVRIKGEAVERGRIREFISKKNLYETSKADFLLRFENIGNTHLKPRGDIAFYNMWGKERGKVTINQEGNFGNVLPHSIRRFEFSWEGEKSILDIGRYSAVVTLGYGQDNKQNASATTYFWVVPVVPVLIGIGSLVLFVFLVMWFIRRYIRRALTLEKGRVQNVASGSALSHAHNYSLGSLIEPIKEGVVDLRSIGRVKTSDLNVVTTQSPEFDVQVLEKLTAFGFLQKYSLFFFFVAVIAVGAIGVWTYFDNVLLPQRAFEITNVTSEEEASEPHATDE